MSNTAEIALEINNGDVEMAICQLDMEIAELRRARRELEKYNPQVGEDNIITTVEEIE